MGRKIVLMIEGAGEVFIEHSMRATRITISVRPGGVRVAVPKGVPLERGRDFALARENWIRHHSARMADVVKASRDALMNLTPLADPGAARKRIIERLDELSVLHKLPYASATVRNQKTRWGSCSVRKTISLNINLTRLPSELMDYVIVHELVHTKIRGHGPDFWSSLTRLVPDAPGLRKKLGRYSYVLTHPDGD